MATQLPPSVFHRTIDGSKTEEMWWFDARATRPISWLLCAKANASIDKDLALSRVLTAEQLFSDTLSRPRFGALLLASVATLGLFSYNWCVLRINNRANFVQRFSPITS